MQVSVGCIRTMLRLYGRSPPAQNLSALPRGFISFGHMQAEAPSPALVAARMVML